MKLIQDLGMQFATENSKRKYRYGIYECPCCKKHLKFISNSVNSGHTTKCRSCATKNVIKKTIDNIDFKLNKEMINEIFEYKEGNLFYKKRLSTSVKIGDKVGYQNNIGYVKTKIKGKSYFVHRLIWIYHFGDTDLDIDHIDHNTFNNRIENLRIVNHIDNCRNRKLRKDNTSGFNGVMFNKSKKKWEVYLSQKYIGAFLTKEEAIEKRKEINLTSGYHKNHGKEKIC